LVRVAFDDSSGGRQGFFSGPVTMVTFGSEQYVWHADGPNGHPVPDGPPVTSMLSGGAEAAFVLPFRCS